MKIVLITSQFPPEDNGGVGRPFSLYKYLPCNGIEVKVFTKAVVKPEPDFDGVVRLETFANWRNSGYLTRKRLLRYITLPAARFRHGLTDTLWIKTALKEITACFQNKRPDLIYATFPGVDVLQIGIQLRKIWGIPLITEFRDGLVFEPNIRQTKHIRKIYGQLEKETVSQSDAIITIGNTLSSYFLNTYPGHKVQTVFNGYDDDDFLGLTDFRIKDGVTRIVHFGRLNQSRKSNRVGLFYALKRLFEDGIIEAHKFEVLFIGNFTDEEMKVPVTLGIDSFVHYLPPMKKKEGFDLIKEKADYLLLYGVEGDSSVLSTKLFEYLKLGKPILGICEGNEAAEVIQHTGTGEVCGFSQEPIHDLLLKALNNKVVFSPNHSRIEAFSRKSQAAQIAGIIKNVVEEQQQTI